MNINSTASQRSRVLILQVLAAVLALLLAMRPACGDTTINISSTVVTPAVKRFGINLGPVSYFDSGQVMKELVFRNPGFEPVLYQSIIRCASGTATNCIDDITSTNSSSGIFTVWPNGFWDGATFEVVWGTAKERIGTVVASTAPSGGRGTVY